LLRRGKSHREALPCAVVALTLALALAACETVHDHVGAGGAIGVVVRPTTTSAQSTESTENIIKQGHPTHVVMMGVFFLFVSPRAAHYFVELYNTCAWGRRGPSRAACWAASSISSGVTTCGNRQKLKVREEAQSLDLAPSALEEPWCFLLDSAITTWPHFAVVEMLLRERWRLQKMAAMVREVATIIGEYCTEGGRLVHIPRTVV
jgi:hypothetical protein